MHKFLKYAYRLGLEHNFPDSLEQHICAVIVRGGNVLSVGFNKPGMNSFVQHFQNITKQRWCSTTHAEQDAILRVRNSIDLTCSKIFVVRIRKEKSPLGNMGLARPCPICQEVIRQYGIKRAYYTISDTEYGVLNVVR